MKIELSRRRTRQRERGLQQIQLELDAQIKLEAQSLPLSTSLPFLSLSLPLSHLFVGLSSQRPPHKSIKSKCSNTFDSASSMKRIYSRFTNVCPAQGVKGEGGSGGQQVDSGRKCMNSVCQCLESLSIVVISYCHCAYVTCDASK